MEFRGSQTEKNLETAFSGESQARNRYNIFADIARKAGYIHIARIFEETAENEREHGRVWYSILRGDSINSILENLMDAAEKEHYEWTNMYAGFSKTAKDEGFDHISFLFDKIRNIEKMHDHRYLNLIEDLKNEEEFKKTEKVNWECAKCGLVIHNEEAPKVCPFCQEPQGYFFVSQFDGEVTNF